MLTPFDDYPIHQTPLPVAHAASADRNHYDRYFFNGFDRDAGWYIGIAMGLYPNRRVIDAAFSVVHDGTQRSVFASGRAPLDPTVTRVGPISIEVVEPLRVNRVRVNASDLGIEADLTWEARTAAIEEPRQTLVDGSQTMMDVTRLVQWGSWRGAIEAGGRRLPIDPARSLGTKDRSWGVRPVGEPLPGAPATGWAGGGLFLLWGPVHFAGECTHLILFEFPNGHRWFESAFSVPVLGPGDPAWGAEEKVRHSRTVDYAIDFRPGTRRSRSARLDYRFRDGGREALSFEPLLDFQMKGIGYWHPDWAHGHWRGEEVVGGDSWRLDQLDPLDFSNLHVQQLCRVRRGDEEGIGVLEQQIHGPHAPTGFTDALDGAKG
jgi:hypothetical protein